MNVSIVPEGYVLRTRGRVSVLVREDIARAVEGMGVFDSPDPASWKGASGFLKGGRGRPTRIRLSPDSSMIVKALLRGGILSTINRSLHGSMSRIFKEASLSNHLIGKGVPITPMLLGRAERRALVFYRLHIGSKEVEGAVNLLDLMNDWTGQESHIKKCLNSAGRSVRALHDAGVFHSDLNLGNLLVVPPGEGDGTPLVKVIDLDRSVAATSLRARSRAANLARLYRHAVKNGLHRQVDLKPLWRSFLEGYTQGNDEIPNFEETVDRLVRKSLFLHRLSWWIQGR